MTNISKRQCGLLVAILIAPEWFVDPRHVLSLRERRIMARLRGLGFVVEDESCGYLLTHEGKVVAGACRQALALSIVTERRGSRS